MRNVRNSCLILCCFLLSLSGCKNSSTTEIQDAGCTVGSIRCLGDRVQTCGVGGWIDGKTCDFGCNTGQTACNGACNPGERLCADKTLKSCKADGSGYDEQVCEQGCDKASTTCYAKLSADAGQDQTLVVGETASLAGKAEDGDGTYSYSWSDGNAEVGTTAALDVKPTQTTTYTLSVTDGQGNVATDTVIVTVSDALSAQAGDNLKVVKGTRVKLAGKSAGGIGERQCEWWFADKLIATICEHEFAPDASGKATLKVKDAAGHTAESSLTIEVFEPLALTLTADNPQVLADGQAVLTLKIAGGVTPIKSCLWDDEAKSTSCDTISVTVKSTTTYTVVVIDDSGNTEQASVTVEVVSFAAVAPNTARYCRVPGSSFVINGKALGGVGATTCQWWLNNSKTEPDKKLSDTCVLSVKDFAPTSGSLTLIVEDSNGSKAQKLVTFETADPLKLSATFSEQNLFVSESYELKVADQISGGFTGPVCSLNDGVNSETVDCASKTLTPAQSTHYTVSIDDGGCQVLKASLQVNVFTRPSLESVDDVFAVDGENATIAFTVNNPDKVLGTICVLTDPNNKATLVACSNGLYDVAVDPGSAGGTWKLELVVMAPFQSKDVTVDTKSFSISLLKATAKADKAAIQKGGTVTLSADEISGTKDGNYSCAWVGAKITSGHETSCSGVVATPDETGTYQVEVTDSDTGQKITRNIKVVVLESSCSNNTTDGWESDDDCGGQFVRISEIHYQNTGDDEHEGVELLGPAGLNLDGWSLALYDGSNGTVYATVSLDGFALDQDTQNPYRLGVLWVSTAGLQDGDPDGVALVNRAGAVVEFLSYGGKFSATDGPASGMESTDIGKKQLSDTAKGLTLQLIGDLHASPTWSDAVSHSRGKLNPNLKIIYQLCGLCDEGDTCNAQRDCGNQTTCCSNTCVDTETDLDHCGGCNTAAPEWFVDVDRDGDPGHTSSVISCTRPKHGYKAPQKWDCDDDNPNLTSQAYLRFWQSPEHILASGVKLDDFQMPVRSRGMTWSFWLKLSGPPSADWRNILHVGSTNIERRPAIFIQPNKHQIHVSTSDSVSWNTHCDSTTEVLPVGEWFFVAVTYTPGATVWRTRIYINGKLDKTCIGHPQLEDIKTYPVWAGNPWTSAPPTTYIDNIRAECFPRTQEQVQELMNSGHLTP